MNLKNGFTLLLATVLSASAQDVAKVFSPERDFISLHYDHAPDKDDGHSVAADRTILQSMFGVEWIQAHTVAVSGAYGKNEKTFNPKSDVVMNAAWNGCGDWLAAHTNRDAVVRELVGRWTKTIEAGGDVWVKEGGQSDITAATLEQIRAASPAIDTRKRIHVVQHSNWNENQTTDAALSYTKANSDYIRIKDANAYLNLKGGDEVFEKAALGHPVYGAGWKAAFAYYNPKQRLDFSDTGELMRILGLGEMNLNEFRERFLTDNTQAK
ncbi:MAG: hypothetical protein PHO37_07440 [Kiritimatiellae bacterium]|nr:hypothetical protein [Kiritimatiellia bacterium]